MINCRFGEDSKKESNSKRKKTLELKYRKKEI